MNQSFEELAATLELGLSEVMRRQLEAFRRWLHDEGIPGGGLGPAEGPLLESRHLVDSLTFAAGWPSAPRELWDVGSGVGLPGIVLAAVWPETVVTLIDRSERRCDLARRASRVAGVEVVVERADITDCGAQVEAVVSRAAIPAPRFRPILERILLPGGRAVISGDGRPVEGYQIVHVLDRPTRLLMMQRS